MKRIYEYRRHLPHYQSDNEGIFVTFCRRHRWVLPEEARGPSSPSHLGSGTCPRCQHFGPQQGFDHIGNYSLADRI